jgi:hypothetical protein
VRGKLAFRFGGFAPTQTFAESKVALQHRFASLNATIGEASERDLCTPASAKVARVALRSAIRRAEYAHHRGTDAAVLLPDGLTVLGGTIHERGWLAWGSMTLAPVGSLGPYRLSMPSWGARHACWKAQAAGRALVVNYTEREPE